MTQHEYLQITPENCSTLTRHRRVGAQRRVAERHEPHAVRAAAASTPPRSIRLRADDDRRIVRHGLRSPQRLDERLGARADGARLDQHQASAPAGGSSSQSSKRQRRADLRQDRAARLLHRRQRDAPPALDARASHQRGDGRLGALGDDRLNRAATPSITASRTTSSILSPLSTACASVSATRGSAAGSTRDSSCTRTSRRAGARRRARETRGRGRRTRHRVADAEPQHARQMLRLVARQRRRSRRRDRATARRIDARAIIRSTDSITARHESATDDLVAAVYSRADVLPRSDHREIQDPLDDRQRRLRHGLPRRRHLDRQESRAQGSAQAGRRLRRAAARAAAARHASTIPTSSPS